MAHGVGVTQEPLVTPGQGESLANRRAYLSLWDVLTEVLIGCSIRCAYRSGLGWGVLSWPISLIEVWARTKDQGPTKDPQSGPEPRTHSHTPLGPGGTG